MTTLLLDRVETHRALDPAELLPLVREALVQISSGEVDAPPRVAAQSPAGLLGAMPGYVPGMGLAAKLTSVFSVPGGGSSRHRGVVLLVDEACGEPLAIMDAEPLTALRTAASATIAMQCLAPPSVQRIAIIGSGAQARAQLRYLALSGTPADVVIASRNPEHARRAAAEHPSARALDSVREAVDGAEIVLCCTDAASPVVQDSWLARGAYLSSVGGSHGPEIDRESIERGALFVEWAGAATQPPPAGAHELQGVPAARVTLIGGVLDGSTWARDGEELTVFKSTGQAALDVAAAVAAYRRATEHGLGQRVRL